MEDAPMPFEPRSRRVPSPASPDVRGMDPRLIAALKALTDATRLRIVGRLAAGPATVVDLAAAVPGGRSATDRHLRRLVDSGLVERAADGTLSLRLDVLQGLGRELDALERSASGAADGDVAASADGFTPEEARVLRSFIVDGRLESIPAQGKKRAVILRYLREACFPDDRPYPEKEVNQRLALFHRDVAALRRYLVDGGLMRRAAGEYRRVDGGSERSGETD